MQDLAVAESVLSMQGVRSAFLLIVAVSGASMCSLEGEVCLRVL